MNPLLPMIAMQQGPALPASAISAAAPVMDFDVQLTAALAADDKAAGQQDLQIAKIIADENPIDSSISVVADARHALPVENSNTSAAASIQPTTSRELPEPSQSPESQMAEPAPEIITFVELPPIPLTPLQQTSNLTFPALTTRGRSIALIPVETARPTAAKIAAPPIPTSTVFESVQFEAFFAPVISLLPSASKLEAPTPTLDIYAADWIARLSHNILSAHESSASNLAFRLTPRHLGTLDVGLTETPQGLIVELRPSNEEAKAIIAREEPRLIDELRQRGIPVADPALHSGANGDGRHNRNGAIPRPFLPFIESDQKTVQDQDQQSRPHRGRFA